MGSGSGIQGETALKHGAKSVLAVDIDPTVVKHLTKKHLNVLQSDLFSEVEGIFDVIAFNPPYLPRDTREDAESEQITSGGEKGDEIVIRFLKQAPKHLAKKGTLLVILSSLTPHSKIMAEAKKQGLVAKKVDQVSVFMETLELWEFRNKVYK